MLETWRIFLRFLYLGCVSFGGPAAHIAYFRKEFVEQRRWLSSDEFAAQLALCQFLPGPASSQLGFSIACHRGGLPGGIVAFIGFTLPSFLLMWALGAGQQGELGRTLFDGGIVEGLKLLAVAVVADAIWTMGRQFCQRVDTVLITLLTTAVLLWGMTPLLQLGMMLLAAVLGYLRCRDAATLPSLTLTPLARVALLGFLMSLGLCLFFSDSVFSLFYRAGSMVFGGGHVVLPLLQGFIGDGLPQDQFLLGYAAAQAVPGPMFSFASYLGAALRPESALLFATLATLGVFLPGFLLVVGLRPMWQTLSAHPRIAAAIGAVNAAAVGILLAAWFDPIATHAPDGGAAVGFAVAGFIALRTKRVPILLLILAFALLGWWRF